MSGSRGAYRPKDAAIAVAVGVVVFTVCCISVTLTRNGHTITPFWPATAIALCAMLRCGGSIFRRVSILLAAAAAIVGANYVCGSARWVPFLFGGANCLELLLAVVIAERWAPKTFATPAAGWDFLLKVGVIPPLLGASLSALATLLTNGPAPATVGVHWYMAHLLGFLLIGPFGMTLSTRSLKRLNLQSRSFEAIGVAALVLISAGAVFAQALTPVLFLVLPSMLVATFRFRLVGAGAAALLVAIVAVPATALGSGPIALAPIHPDFLRILVLQLFLATNSLVCLPVASVLNDRDRKGALLEAQRVKAIHASEAKSELLAHVSHDVRSPLTAIIGFAGLMKQGMASPEQTVRFAGLIIKNAEFLKALSDDLLDIAKVEAGALSIRREPVDLGDMLDHLETTFSDSADALTVTPVAAGALVVEADGHRLVQVLNNLTSNALKYGAEYGPVTVQASALDPTTARILVVNRGPGISEAQRTELFKPFARLGAELGKIAGAGLGLSITKQLVELQGGVIDMTSIPNEETRFWVDLPLAPPATNVNSRPAAEPQLRSAAA